MVAQTGTLHYSLASRDERLVHIQVAVAIVDKAALSNGGGCAPKPGVTVEDGQQRQADAGMFRRAGDTQR